MGRVEGKLVSVTAGLADVGACSRPATRHRYQSLHGTTRIYCNHQLVAVNSLVIYWKLLEVTDYLLRKLYAPCHAVAVRADHSLENLPGGGGENSSLLREGRNELSLSQVSLHSCVSLDLLPFS